MAAQSGCDDQTVLDAVHAFNADGLARLVKGSSRPKRMWQVFGPAQAERLRALLHCSPRDFGQPTSVWTLALAAEVTAAQGIVADRVSGETIR
ncbi:MAG: helix-turn-helix domain-containing protein [Ktedonobacterales bacterium]